MKLARISDVVVITTFLLIAGCERTADQPVEFDTRPAAVKGAQPNSDSAQSPESAGAPGAWGQFVRCDPTLEYYLRTVAFPSQLNGNRYWKQVEAAPQVFAWRFRDASIRCATSISPNPKSSPKITNDDKTFSGLTIDGLVVLKRWKTAEIEVVVHEEGDLTTELYTQPYYVELEVAWREQTDPTGAEISATLRPVRGFVNVREDGGWNFDKQHIRFLATGADDSAYVDLWLLPAQR